MDYRKLISFGKGGYVISIPKNWVEENKLEKGSFIGIECDTNSLRLMARPGKSEKQEENEIIIDVDGEPNPNIYRKLRSAYLNSYSTIILKGQELKNKREAIKERVKKLIALEIFESSKDRMVLKDLLNFNNVDFLKDFKKMDMIIRSVFIDIKKFDPELYESIDARDDEIDRLFFLLLRTLKKSLQDPQIRKRFNLNLLKATNYWVYVHSLENLGDELIILLKACQNCKFSKKSKKDFLQLYEKTEKVYLETMKIIHTEDFKASFDMAESHKKLIRDCLETNKKYGQDKNILMCLEYLQRVIRTIHVMLKNYYY